MLTYVTRLEFVPDNEDGHTPPAPRLHRSFEGDAVEDTLPTTLRLYRPVEGGWEVSTWTRAPTITTVGHGEAPADSLYLARDQESVEEVMEKIHDCDWFDCNGHHDIGDDL